MTIPDYEKAIGQRRLRCRVRRLTGKNGRSVTHRY